MAPINGAKMEQKTNSGNTSAIAGRNDRHKDHDKDVKQLLLAVEANRAEELPVSIQQSLMRARHGATAGRRDDHLANRHDSG
jgi:hypothetical protein